MGEGRQQGSLKGMIAAGPAVDAIETGIKQRSKGAEFLEEQRRRMGYEERAGYSTDAGAIPFRPFRFRLCQLPTELHGCWCCCCGDGADLPRPFSALYQALLSEGKGRGSEKNAPVLSVSTVRVQWAALAHGRGSCVSLKRDRECV